MLNQKRVSWRVSLLLVLVFVFVLVLVLVLPRDLQYQPPRFVSRSCFAPVAVSPVSGHSRRFQLL